MSSDSAIATTSALTSTWSLGGSPGADAYYGLHRLHLKTKHLLGSWLLDGRYGFLRRLTRGKVSDLEFDGVSGCCLDLVRSMAMVSPLVSHLGGP